MNNWLPGQENTKAQLADYYRMISHIDDRIGNIVETLKKNKLYDNTIIVYSADNGLAVGSHGLMGKQSLYEHSMNTPLIITGPGIPQNKQSDALVYLLDLYPTLCSILGVKTPEGLEGTDYSEVVYGKKEKVRNTLFTAYREIRAVRNEQYKLIRYPMIDHTQLFDLKNDPNEINNLIYNDDYNIIVEELTKEMKRWQQQTGDTLVLENPNPRAKEYDYKTLVRIPDRHQPQYVLDKYFPEYANDALFKVHRALVFAANAQEIKGLQKNYLKFKAKMKAKSERKALFEKITAARDSSEQLQKVPDNYTDFERLFNN